MKKNMKRLGSLLLTAALCTSVLAGCGAKAGEAEGGADAGTGGGGQEAAESGAVELTAVIKDMSADDEASQRLLETISEGVSDQLGKEVHISLAPISEGSYSESVSLLLQSGEIPDLIYFQGGDYQFAITQQILEDLTPYVEGSTYVKAMMEPYNEKRMANYPYLLWMAPDRIKVPVVRKDWFDASESGKALLSDPTVENYKAFFQELKDTHGLQAAYTVPGDLSELDMVFNFAFGVNQTWLKQEDGTYIYSKVSPQQKEKLAFYAELYADGLLDKEWLSKKWDTKESAFYNGEVGVVAGTQGATVNVYDKKMKAQNGEEAALMVLPPAKGIDQGYAASNVSKEERGWAINADSPYKEEAFAVLEYMAGPEGQVLDKLGYEGEQYTKDGEQYALTEMQAEWYARFHETIKTFDVEFSPETPYFGEAAEESLKMTQEYSAFDNAFVLPDDFVTNWDAGEALYSEFASDVISGKKSIDEFDKYVEDWNALGGAEITAYANENIKE